jgi:MFS-type transporter involved in bile tolerance (Atg22 family)
MNLENLFILPLKDLFHDTTYILRILTTHIERNLNSVNEKLVESEIFIFLFFMIFIYYSVNTLINYIYLNVFKNEKFQRMFKEIIRYLMIMSIIGAFNIGFLCYRYYKKAYL